ncbi:conserved hypothetical protein [Gluconacetobacter diazotrophicus PA1 5]|nr:hypothetical protein [Gluconacetobacter diazotrophicus]ACI52496.1 conserved hypothetical protein [Gluconacetobacter diazotrophicus PA1 5]TWB03107.1 hypothetical protein FBZ86_12218 [Gluconacetobacter diazotrophicus]
MNHMTAPRPSPPGHSIGYWAVMVAGITIIVALYAGILVFGQAW